MSLFHLGREIDDPEHLRIERYLIARGWGRYRRPIKINDEIQTPPSH
jgi:hypothetical protein